MKADSNNTIKSKKADTDAQFKLGYEMAYGKEFTKFRPWKKIFCLWKAAALDGHVEAMYYLGTCYDNGYGIRKNLKVAFRWYLNAAKLGQRDSQYNVGTIFRDGEIVRKNMKKAVYWFKLSAKNDLCDAQRDLGYCYFYGQGIKKDQKKAIFWYKKAAAMNDSIA